MRVICFAFAFFNLPFAVMLAMVCLSTVADNPIVTKQPPQAAAPAHELTFGEYDKIELIANYVVPEGYESRHTWEIDGAESTAYDDGRILAVWARPGTYRATFEAWLINWDLRKQEHLKEHFNLIVQGARPPPDDVDTTDTIGPVFSLVLRNAEELTADQTAALAAIRDWVDQQPAGTAEHHELDIDAVGPDGEPEPRVKEYTDAIPDTSKLPYAFLSKKKRHGGAVMLWAGELGTAAEHITRLQELQ